MARARKASTLVAHWYPSPFLISDRFFSNFYFGFTLTVVHLHAKERKRRREVGSRKTVGCQRARGVQRVLVGHRRRQSSFYIPIPAAGQRSHQDPDVGAHTRSNCTSCCCCGGVKGPTYSFDQEGKHARVNPDHTTTRTQAGACQRNFPFISSCVHLSGKRVKLLRTQCQTGR